MPPQTVDRDLDNARRRATHTQTGLDAKNEAGDEHAGNALFAGRRDAIHEIPVPGRPPRPQRVALKFGGRTRGYPEGEPGDIRWLGSARYWSSRVAPKKRNATSATRLRGRRDIRGAYVAEGLLLRTWEDPEMDTCRAELNGSARYRARGASSRSR